MTKKVMVKPRVSNRWVRSIMGMIWPEEGNGYTTMCGLVLVLVLVVDIVVVDCISTIDYRLSTVGML